MRLSDVSGVKVLGRAIGSAKPVKPSEVDGDGDGFLTGPDGRDNIPAPRKFESLVGRDGSVVRFFRIPHENNDMAEQINVVDDKGNVVEQIWAMKGAREWREREPVKAAESILNKLDNLEKKFSKKHGDIRDPKNMAKAVRSAFPNLTKDFDLEDLYPLRNDDGSVRDVDVARVAMLLEAAERDPDTAKRIDKISVTGKMVGGLFNADLPGVFVYGTSDNSEKHFFAGLDFSPNSKPLFQENHGWGLKILTEMRDAGYSKKDIDKFYASYIAAHEYGHAQHIMRVLENDGIKLNAKSEEDLISNLRVYAAGRNYQTFDSDEELDLAIRGELFMNGEKERYKDKSEEERRRLAILALISDAEGSYLENLRYRPASPALWDDLSESEIADISKQSEWRKVSGYAAVNGFEFVAETLAQDLMGHEEGYTPQHWGKMAEWIKSKAANVKNKLTRKKLKGIDPNITGGVTALCDGFAGAKPQKKASDIKSIVIVPSEKQQF